jgi:hypothetical protein
MKNLRTILFLFAAVALFACDDDKEVDKPTPFVDFVVNNELIGVSWEVKLTNISDRTPIKHFEWDFGDGNEPEIVLPIPSSSDIPFHRYSAPGEYTITLTGVEEDGTRTSKEHKIRVGEALINKVEVRRISENKNNDTSKKWDDESEGDEVFPDIQLGLKVNDEVVYESETYSNVSGKHLPLEIGIPSVKLKLSELGFLTWGDQQQFYLYDIDGEDKELMIAPEICSIVMNGSVMRDYELNSGILEVMCADYLFYFHYELK